MAFLRHSTHTYTFSTYRNQWPKITKKVYHTKTKAQVKNNIFCIQLAQKPVEDIYKKHILDNIEINIKNIDKAFRQVNHVHHYIYDD